MRLSRKCPETAAAIWQELDPLVISDMRRANEHYRQYEGKVQEAATKVNDTYLKAFGQEEGVQSYGKGVVQYVLPVGSRGAGMQLTIAQYFTAKGNEVHKVGITPDVIAEWPEGDTTMYELGDLNDAQLKVAYEEALKLLGK